VFQKYNVEYKYGFGEIPIKVPEHRDPYASEIPLLSMANAGNM
jgi:hypothetical protein